MFDYEVESLVEGDLASGSLDLVLFDLFHEIPHSCLESGMGVID